jgi:predicted Zn-dependent protease
MEYAKNNNFAEANTIAENLLQHAPDQPLLNRIKGYHLTKLGQLEDGFAHLEKAHQNGPKSDTLLMDLAQIAYQLEQNEKAYRYLALVENVRNKRVYDNLKLAISLRLGYALETIPTMFNETPDSFNADAMLEAGLQLTNKNNGKLAKQIYDNVTVNYPSNDSVELGLLGVRLGEISALSIVEKNYIEKKDANSRALYAASMIKLGELDRAEVLANEWIAMDEDLAMGYQTLANIAIERNDEKALDMNMQKLLQIAPENLFANAYLAQKYAKNGQLDKSYELFSKLLELYPGNPNIIASAYNSLKPFGKVQDIVELVSSEKRTDDIVLVPYYSTILLREQRYQDVVEMIEKFAAQPELPDSAWNNYIFSIRALGNLQAALAANKQWVQRKPNSIAAYMSLVVSYELSNQPKEALSTIKRIDEKFGRTTATALTRIYFLILDRQLELANSEFESLAKTKDVVDIPFYKGVRGRLAYFEQDYTSAVADLNDEYNNTRNEKTLKFLVSALKADNKVAEGIELLKEFLDGQPNDLITLLQLADLAHDVDSATAEDAYIQILKLRPKNLYASNNYAMLLLSQNNPQKAKALIDNVLFDNQLNPELVDTAARVYYAGGDSESGNGLFDALVQKTKGEYSTFLYIKYLTDTRQYESAEKVYNDSELTFSTRKEELNELRASW